MSRKLLLYLIRWQLSSPILWVVVKLFGGGVTAVIIANLIGGLIFFPVDSWLIFRRKKSGEAEAPPVDACPN